MRRKVLTRRSYPTYVAGMSNPDVEVFAALANPVRRDILKRLRRGPLTVTDLAQGFRIRRPAVSEHLQVLRRARLVREQPARSAPPPPLPPAAHSAPPGDCRARWQR